MQYADAKGRMISIHALCEEGDAWNGRAERRRTISIHALCEEGDAFASALRAYSFNFYPRPLRGGRRRGRVQGAGEQ